MGISILELVLQQLRDADLAADAAYPGRKTPMITGTVAAVHIEKVDRANQEVTVEVDIICPAAVGGTACELEALKAVEVLSLAGAACVQNGCRYDSMAKTYTAAIQATFTGIAEAEDYTAGPGFKVYIDDVEIPYVVGFTADTEQTCRQSFSFGDAMSTGSSAGKVRYGFRLEELIPAGTELTAESTDFFTLLFENYSAQEIFYGCRWTSVKREFTKEGMRRIREGFARVWEATTHD